MSSTMPTTPDSQIPGDLPARIEARERLCYSIELREPAIVTGPAGTGKSRLLRELRRSLELEGAQVSILDLAGWQAAEFPQRLAVHFGLSYATDLLPLQAWGKLEQWCSALRELQHRQVLLLDHLDRAQGCEAVLDRWLGLSNCVLPTVMALSLPASDAWQPILRRHAPLRIVLPRLTASETGRVALEDLLREQRVSPRALQALHELSRGQLRRLERLTRLAICAAEVEQAELIHEGLVRSVAHEARL